MAQWPVRGTTPWDDALRNYVDAGDQANSGQIGSLATVATTGSYNDLSDKPGLAAVATSGQYADLSGKPTLGTAAATDAAAYATAAQGAKADTAAQPAGDLGGTASSPTVVGGTNHTHTAAQVSGLAAVATSGAYGDLSGRPTLGTAAATDATAYATAAQGALASTAVQPSVVTVKASRGLAISGSGTAASPLVIDSPYQWVGSGSPYGSLTPDRVGIEYKDTAQTLGARKWISTGTTSTSWVVTDGDTGWRDVSSLLLNGWAGTVHVKRMVGWTLVRMYQVSAAAMTGAIIYTLPSGFVPDRGAGYQGVNVAGRTDGTRLRVGGTGGQLEFWLTPSQTSGSFTGSTVFLAAFSNSGAHTWPTALPGSSTPD